MLQQHIDNLKKHMENGALNRNKMGDSFSFDISLTVVSEAIKSGHLTKEQFLKEMNNIF